MRISLDTNIVSGYWLGTPEGQRDFRDIALRQQQGDTFLVGGVVYVELAAVPGVTRATVDAFLRAAKIGLDTTLPAPAWDAAADANHAHQTRRRRSGVTTGRRVPADFLIGAHALHRADALMTRNPADFSDFPALTLIVPV